MRLFRRDREQHAPAGTIAVLQHLTDVHTGISRYEGERLGRVAADLSRLDVVDGIVDTGDSINSGDDVQATLRQDARYLAWRERCAAGRPWAQVLGNHDIWGNLRSATEWATVFGVPHANRVVRIRGLAVVCLGPERLFGTDQSHGGRPAIVLSDATIGWLDETLRGAGPAVVACHTPLPGMTARGPKGWTHTESGGASARDLIEVLAAHTDTVAAYLCGHTHCGPRSPDMVSTARLDGVALPHLNAGWLGCLTFSDTQGRDRPLTSLTVAVRDDLSVEVRWRDHWRGRWYAPQGKDRVVLGPASGQ